MFNLRSLAAAVFSTIVLAPSALSAAVPTQVLTPHGYQLSTNVHEVPQGGKVQHVGSDLHVLDASGTVVKVVPKAASTATPVSSGVAPEQTGWITYANFFNNGPAIGSFKSTWTVPPAPATNHGQTVFLFNSIEPGTFDGIMQPVLQWGGSAAGGGNFWSVASWYLYPGGTFFTTLVDVSPGQVLNGEVQLVGASGGTFNYVSSFTNIGGSGLEVDGGEELAWATITLEAYAVTEASDYPAGSTVFSSTNLELSDGTFPAVTWSVVNDNADGITTTVNAEGSTAAVFTINY